MPGWSFSPLPRLCGALLLCLALAPFCAARDWNYEETHTDSREFAGGGMVHVHLSVGDLHIRRGDGTKTNLRYTVKSRYEKNLQAIQVDFDVHGNQATLEFHAPSSPTTQFDVELEVPQNTNLDLHQKVGDMRVEDVEGDKDLELGVGDIQVTRERSAYKLVRARAGIGDVNGTSYGASSGWLGKSLKYRGDGKYELRAHVGVGDIHLEGK